MDITKWVCVWNWWIYYTKYRYTRVWSWSGWANGRHEETRWNWYGVFRETLPAKGLYASTSVTYKLFKNNYIKKINIVYII